MNTKKGLTIKIKLNQIHFMLKNINKNSKDVGLMGLINMDRNYNINNIIKNFINLNYTKLIKINNGKLFKNNNIIYIVLDMRHLKTKIIMFNRSKCLSFLTNGLIFKKMQFKNKKYKKSEKITYVMLKNFFLRFSNALKNKKIIFYIKGLKNITMNCIKYIKKNTMNSDITFIHNLYINKCKKFKTKKIKSIKKKIKKKIIKYK